MFNDGRIFQLNELDKFQEFFLPKSNYIVTKYKDGHIEKQLFNGTKFIKFIDKSINYISNNGDTITILEKRAIIKELNKPRVIKVLD